MNFFVNKFIWPYMLKRYSNGSIAIFSRLLNMKCIYGIHIFIIFLAHMLMFRKYADEGKKIRNRFIIISIKNDKYANDDKRSIFR